MNDEIKKNVREAYAQVARGQNCNCSSENSSKCCGQDPAMVSNSKLVGYTDADLNTLPEGVDMGLGCGNPVALASLKEGEVVLDLGSGPGMDCFLASARVGPKGKVIGVDMTPEMLEKARANAAKGDFNNVEFRLGEIENMPVPDDTVDVVISNCVINLSPDKRRVFSEIYRVLKPGGRLMVSDIVTEKELPESIRNSREAYCSCIGGAALKGDYLKMIREAGFQSVRIVNESVSYFQPSDFQNNDECCTENKSCCEDTPVVSVQVFAQKPLLPLV